MDFSVPIFGMFAFKDIKQESKFLMLIPFLLPITYILSTTFFPQFIIDFFTRFSDKFDF